MPKRRTNEKTIISLGSVLTNVRTRARLSQAEVARRMSTSQAAIARLEAGRQSPSVSTLQEFARANGFCLEIGFVPAGEETGCVLVVHGAPSDGG